MEDPKNVLDCVGSFIDDIWNSFCFELLEAFLEMFCTSYRYIRQITAY